MSGLRNEDTEWILKFSANDNHPPEGDNNVWTWNQYFGHGDLRISTAIARLGHPYIYTGYKMFAHTATGGFEDSHSGPMDYWFYGSPLNGLYSVIRYDVRVNVTYPEQFDGLPFVWGVGFNSIGWSGSNPYYDGPNYQEGFCRVYPNSQTASGCQLQTFVYDVYQNGNHIGWYPCQINEVSLNYKVWGVPHNIIPNDPSEPKVDVANTAFQFNFSSIYPNPFNATVKINFTLPEDEYATLDIFNLLGQKVATLFDESGSKGSHSVIWNGKDNDKDDVPSGVYFCKLKGNDKLVTQKITLLR